MENNIARTRQGRGGEGQKKREREREGERKRENRYACKNTQEYPFREQTI